MSTLANIVTLACVAGIVAIPLILLEAYTR